MYRIERQRGIIPTGPWEPVGNARYLTRESARRAMGRLIAEALEEAGRLGLPRTPRYRIVEARYLVACAAVH